MFIEYVDPVKLKIDIEPNKTIDIDKKEFLSIFEKKRLELGNEYL